ncbi:MAG: aminotransferase class III-fold pyridoxal phosphate-dependent enzyme [Lachnospiraceae bacterium]|nr:aminotransferase class III-fold pyridoxal phosphate-dependent enzyme [Lachnospiraceae bacterium]
MNIKNNDKEYIANTYGRFDLELVKGKGSLLYDENDKEYIDLGTGIAVNIFGAGDEEWKQAVIDQLNLIPHTSNLYYSVPQVKLAKLLCEKTGMKKVFFGNSGAEANECMIKVIRKYASDKYGDERNIIITLINSFHGRTVTTLSATGQDVFHKSFGPFTGGFLYTPANDFAALKALCEENKGKVAGIMLELVQGEGGVIALTPDFVRKVEAYCKENDILLGIDEVQTGNGRTGKLYAFMNYGITPDVVSTAKGVAGGLPLGACLIGEKCKDTMGAGSHGSTFGGNPVVTAGAYNILSRVDDNLLNGVKEKSKLIIEKLTFLKLDDDMNPVGLFNECDADSKTADGKTIEDVIKNYQFGIWPSFRKGIVSVSGMGLMLGIQTEKEAKTIVNKAIEKGTIALTTKTKVRLLPALNIPNDLLEKGLETILSSIEEV